MQQQYRYRTLNMEVCYNRAAGLVTEDWTADQLALRGRLGESGATPVVNLTTILVCLWKARCDEMYLSGISWLAGYLGVH